MSNLVNQKISLQSLKSDLYRLVKKYEKMVPSRNCEYADWSNSVNKLSRQATMNALESVHKDIKNAGPLIEFNTAKKLYKDLGNVLLSKGIQVPVKTYKTLFHLNKAIDKKKILVEEHKDEPTLHDVQRRFEIELRLRGEKVPSKKYVKISAQKAYINKLENKLVSLHEQYKIVVDHGLGALPVEPVRTFISKLPADLSKLPHIMLTVNSIEALLKFTKDVAALYPTLQVIAQMCDYRFKGKINAGTKKVFISDLPEAFKQGYSDFMDRINKYGSSEFKENELTEEAYLASNIRLLISSNRGGCNGNKKTLIQIGLHMCKNIYSDPREKNCFFKALSTFNSLVKGYHKLRILKH